MKLLFRISLLLLLYTVNANSFAQTSRKIDSLELRLALEDVDSLRLNLLIEIASFYNKDVQNYNKCIRILSEAQTIANRESNFEELSRVYHSFGVLYRNTARYDNALENHQLSLHFAELADNEPLIASALNSIGVVYRRIDNHPKAAEFHLRALKLAEEIDDNYNTSVALNSLGNIYSLNGQYKEAFKYFQRALVLSRSMDNKLGQAINYNNIGEVFEFMGMMDSALVYYTKSLEANKKIESQKGIAISYNAIGKIYLFQEKVAEAHAMFNQALNIDKKLGDKKFIADSYINLARSFLALNKLIEAEECANQALLVSSEIGSITHNQRSYEVLSQIFQQKNQHDTALYLFQKSTYFKDSLLSEKNMRSIAMAEVVFETEKKEKQIQILQQAQVIDQKEISRQKAIRNFYMTGFLFALTLAVMVYSALRIKQKANILLAKQKSEIEVSNIRLNQQQQEILIQNQEIEKQRNNIQLKNKNLEEAYSVIEGYISKMIDSIRYAERIQKAIITPLSLAKTYFSDYFCFYKPKDFVSGDFFWLSQRDDTLFVAVADCTGHGVPGAFMSIIGMDLLNQAINQHSITEPHEILSFLNIELRKKLQKEHEELILKDSMDIAIISIQHNKDVIRYSGALIPLIIMRNRRLINITPNFVSIGTSVENFNVSFKQQEIQIQQGDWLYLFSDGYMDQFGGTERKKFMRHRFWETITNLSNGSGKVQQDEFERVFDEWRGFHEQIDDVLVIGLRV